MREETGRMPRRPWYIALDSIRYNEYIRGVGKGIQAEIQQTKPFTSLEDEALVALQRTADRLHWRLSEMLKAHGLSPTQYNALRILRGAGDQGRACSEIAERMINRDPDITRLVDRLERRGLVGTQPRGAGPPRHYHSHYTGRSRAAAGAGWPGRGV